MNIVSQSVAIVVVYVHKVQSLVAQAKIINLYEITEQKSE